MYCKTCHYSLANLTGRAGQHRCPECGDAFNPNDPRTFETAAQTQAQMRRWRVRVAGYAIIVVLSIYGVVMSYSRQRPEAPFVFILCPFVLGYMAVEAYTSKPR